MSLQAIAIGRILSVLHSRSQRLGSDFEVVADHGSGDVVFRAAGSRCVEGCTSGAGPCHVVSRNCGFVIDGAKAFEKISADESGVDGCDNVRLAIRPEVVTGGDDSGRILCGEGQVGENSGCSGSVLGFSGIDGSGDCSDARDHGEKRGVSSDRVGDSIGGGPSVDGTGVTGRVESKLERNRRWRRERSDRKRARKEVGQDWRQRGRCESNGVTGLNGDVDDADVLLRKSSMAKWRAQNELAAEKAIRELEVLKANDLEQEIRRYRTKVSSQTERNMVAIEKTHAYLKSTGNVPGVAPVVVPGLDHDVHTVSDTISPDSSASQHEFRMCQKKLLDSEKKIADYERAFAAMGVSPLAAENFDKETFTDDTLGNEIYQEMHGGMPDAIYHVVRDGKTKFKVGLDPDRFC